MGNFHKEIDKQTHTYTSLYERTLQHQLRQYYSLSATCMRDDARFDVVVDDSTKCTVHRGGEAIEISCPQGTRFNIIECGFVDSQRQNHL